MVAEAAKRRTLSKSDVATAVERRDMFDFLIDIVPRGESSPFVAKTSATKAEAAQGPHDSENKKSRKGDKGKERESEREGDAATTQDEVAAALDQDQSGSVSPQVCPSLSHRRGGADRSRGCQGR
jgi:TFIIF-interacting CTD phosphatase-like protein